MRGSLLDQSSSVTKPAHSNIQQVRTCYMHYVVNSLRQLVETPDPSPGYTYEICFMKLYLL